MSRLFCYFWAISLACTLFATFGKSSSDSLDYARALDKSILFLEAQRSGKLPPTQRVTWRADSGLSDGALQNVDLVGGYYDAGDNVKYGLPMAFTVTTLAWSAIQYHKELASAGQLLHIREAIKWGTDYFLKASATPFQLWVQVGDPIADHNCWERPEQMDTPRSLYKIDSQNPGTEIAAETAAALAASSIVFRDADSRYSANLLRRAKLLFKFADKKRGTYKGECPFYCSYSGYKDELLWAAAWLYKATSTKSYLRYLKRNYTPACVSEFSWDLKYAGIQVLLSPNSLASNDSLFQKLRTEAESFVCAVHPQSPFSSVSTTPGGMLYVREGANTQYVTGAAFLFSVFSDMLVSTGLKLRCGKREFRGEEVMAFAKKQVDYLLGKNPKGMSYMVGFGERYPRQAHHRAASIPSVREMSEKIECVEGFMQWYHSAAPNPNVLDGAVVGGPDKHDQFDDKRSDSTKLEPATYINSPLVGVLAKLSSTNSR